MTLVGYSSIVPKPSISQTGPHEAGGLRETASGLLELLTDEGIDVTELGRLELRDVIDEPRADTAGVENELDAGLENEYCDEINDEEALSLERLNEETGRPTGIEDDALMLLELEGGRGRSM
jgi:hypothetical protein